MAFKPTLPSAEDWARDPAGSWGRIQQALNYSIDVYNATKAQIPALRARIATMRAQLARFPADAPRSALLDAIQRHETAVAALQLQASTIQARTLDAIAQARALAQQIGQTLKTVGLGQLPVAAIIAVIGVVGLVVAGALQFATAYQTRKAESDGIAAKILDYANAHNLTPSQIREVSDSLAKNKPKDTTGFGLFDQLGGILPLALGVLAVVFLGPPLLKRLGVSIGGAR